MFERFTDRARRVVVLAQEEARLLNHNYIGTEHILLGLIHEAEGVAARALVSLGIPLAEARRQVEAIIGPGQSPPHGHIPFTPRAKKVLELSLREALQFGHNYIGTEHVLLGLVREGEGVAAQVLVRSGADLASVRRRVTELLEQGVVEEFGGVVPEWEAHLAAQEEVGDVMREASGTAGVSQLKAVAGAHRSPICPRCKGGLERTARIAVLEVPDADGDARPVRFVFCSSCGEALLAIDD